MSNEDSSASVVQKVSKSEGVVGEGEGGKERKDGPGPVMVSDTLHILGT